MRGENISEKHLSDILKEEHYWRKSVQEIGGGEIITEKKYPREKYLRWKRLWKIYLQGKYSQRVNTTREGKHVDGDILHETLPEKKINTEGEKIVWGEQNWKECDLFRKNCVKGKYSGRKF